MKLVVLTGGKLVELEVCPVCAALVFDPELHKRWHERKS